MKFFLLLIFFQLLLASLPACTSLPQPLEPPRNTPADKKNNIIYVISHGWHTGVAVPAHSLVKSIPELGQRFPNTSYLEVGWGDKGFYQANEITTALTIHAVFRPTDAVLHIVGLSDNPALLFPESKVYRVTISTTELNNLVLFISNSFSRDANGNPIKSKTGLYGDSQFYNATGHYYMFNTCNTWTAKAMKSAGLTIPDDIFPVAASDIELIFEQKQ